MSQTDPCSRHEFPPHTHDLAERESSRTEFVLIAVTLGVVVAVVLLIIFWIGPTMFSSALNP